jgi:hypothetical protein
MDDKRSLSVMNVAIDGKLTRARTRNSTKDLLFFVFKIFLDGAYLGLIIEFSLPASSYATMALREIVKMELSGKFPRQTSLNDASGTKRPAPTTDTSEAKCEEVKRIKLNVNDNSAPPAFVIEKPGVHPDQEP